MKGNADSSAGGRPGALTIVVATLAALALAGCSSSGCSAPPVASLGTSSGPGTSTSSGTGGGTSGGGTSAKIASNVTALLNEWAACERSHGDPDQSDPTVSAAGVIYITGSWWLILGRDPAERADHPYLKPHRHLASASWPGAGHLPITSVGIIRANPALEWSEVIEGCRNGHSR